MIFLPPLHLGALVLTAAHRFRDDGARKFLHRSISKIRDWRWNGAATTISDFDRDFGTDTAGVVPLWQLDIDSPFRDQGVRYQATDAESVRTAIECLPIDLQDFSYIDLGSGKGRTLLVASEYPFRKVVGIEFSDQLHKVAVENIRKYSNPARRCFDVKSHCGDAATFAFPPDDTVIFLYNPFGEPVMKRVLENLKLSLGRAEHQVYVVYCNPVLESLFDAADFLERLDLGVQASIYRSRL